MYRKIIRTFSTHVKSYQKTLNVFKMCDSFEHRHIGTNFNEQKEMLSTIGFRSMNTLINNTIPEKIRFNEPLILSSTGMTEHEALIKMESLMKKNVIHKSFLGQGYYDTITPNVIKRNILENPGWYTAYTPYQGEISQGRLESLFNFQTMVCELTAMDTTGASLLDEGTAAAEAMNMCKNKHKNRSKIFISETVHPQTIDILKTRSCDKNIELVIGNHHHIDFSQNDFFGCIVQYPDTNGIIHDFRALTIHAHSSNTPVIVASDLLACTQVMPPGEWGADIVVGNAQRFGVPFGFGGPHAGFLACTTSYQRSMPGRIISMSKDVHGETCYRTALQTREQHIRRDKATSNICTSQVLLANLAVFYGIYHGADGLKQIAQRIHILTNILLKGFEINNISVLKGEYFDTLKVTGIDALKISEECNKRGLNIRVFDCGTACGISIGETCNQSDIINILEAFKITTNIEHIVSRLSEFELSGKYGILERNSNFMNQTIFKKYRTETKLLRLMKKYENSDLSLVHSMIPLGSCTMKLNATTEMIPLTWPEVSNIHPFAPQNQSVGYTIMIEKLHSDLATITGFEAISSQPNSGAQGEYAGLRCIRKYHIAQDESHRNICLIPISAHGTNPASAIMAGYTVVSIQIDTDGNIDIKDLKDKLHTHKNKIGALMITYPSTYGVFEESVVDIIDLVHGAGGQVYMDGANMNAQCGWTSPGYIGADVCHLNLHKTFCIPHGGGGPGVGSIGVAKHLVPFLPGHISLNKDESEDGTGAISAAPYGSASILTITYMYLQMLGQSGLRNATASAILNANYMANQLKEYYDILFLGVNGTCAHEFIIDIRPFKTYGITEEDIAKRLQDYGFHAPTMSWPVKGSLMIEPTESECKEGMDRFCNSLIMIRTEIDDIKNGNVLIDQSPLKHAPHTQHIYGAEEWSNQYSRATAAFPAPWMTQQTKFWPMVGRIDNVFGDRNLIVRLPTIGL